MKILFVTYCRAMFGANLALIQLMTDLKERYGVESYVLMWDVEDGTLHEELDRLQIPYLIHPLRTWVVSADKKLKKLRGLKTYIKNKKYVRQIIAKLSEERFDLIYTNNSTVQIGADIAKKLGLKHIWHVREYIEHYNIEFSYPKSMVKKMFDRAAAVVAISNGLEEHVKKTISASANTVRIYDGVSSNKAVRTEWNNSGKLQFCYVGVLQEGKNQLELLKAVRLLVQKGITGFHVTLIGEGQDYEEKLKAYTKENYLTDYITFSGYCNNVMEILDSMDIGVICSRNEGFGRVTVEYMLSSMPVIGAIGSGTSELIIHEETGYLYPGGEEDKLADYMNQMIEDRNLLRKMGQQAYSHAKENFTSEKNTDMIYQLMKNIL